MTAGEARERKAPESAGRRIPIMSGPTEAWVSLRVLCCSLAVLMDVAGVTSLVGWLVGWLVGRSASSLS